MKNGTKTIISILTTALLAGLTSCSDVIFDTIREEVKLSDAQLTGTVHSLIRVQDSSDSKEYLFATTNSIVWRKDINDAVESGTDEDSDGDGVTTSENGHWENFTAPGKKFVLLAANSKGEIYASTTQVESVTDSGENEPITSYLKYYDTNNASAGWQDVKNTDGTAISVSISSESTKQVVFCTNTPKNAHRYAFANIAGTIYSLDGGVATEIDEDDTTCNFVSYGSSVSAATFDGNTFYFSSNTAMTTNENYNTDATMMYYASGKYIYYRDADDTAWSSKYVSDISSVNAIGITGNKILVGTEGGLDAVKFADDGYTPTSDDTSVSANASSTLSSSYIVNQLLVVNPAKNDTATDIYAATNFTGTTSSSSATRKNASMWAYFVARGKWNRE